MSQNQITNASAATTAQIPTALKIRKMTEMKSKNFGIYLDGQLVEGGFFSKAAAVETACREYSQFACADLTEFNIGLRR